VRRSLGEVRQSCEGRGWGWDGKWWPRILARSSHLASGRTSSLPGFHDRLPRQSRSRCAGREVQWRRRMSCRTLRKAEHDGRVGEDLNPSPDALHPTQAALVQADEFLRRPRRCFRIRPRAARIPHSRASPLALLRTRDRPSRHRSAARASLPERLARQLRQRSGVAIPPCRSGSCTWLGPHQRPPDRETSEDGVRERMSLVPPPKGTRGGCSRGLSWRMLRAEWARSCYLLSRAMSRGRWMTGGAFNEKA
jgi:hypothetical protein